MILESRAHPFCRRVFASIVERACAGGHRACRRHVLPREETHRQLAASARLPAVYGFREHVDAGGLISYGVNLAQNFRRSATYVDKILKGAKPGDLPVEFPNKLELVINLKTAKALGLDIGPTLMARADDVIE